jgi:hypothetical protein
MRSVMLRLVALAIVAGLLGGAAPVVAGSASPEDAAREYLAGVAEADLARVTGSAAIDQAAQGVDFVAYVDRLRTWMPFQAPAPATDPFLTGLNRAQLTSQLLGQTRSLIYSLLTDAELDGSPIVADAAWAESFVDQLDLARLADLEVVDVRVPEPEQATSQRYLDILARQAAIWGADALEERVALVTFEGQHYLVGFMLLRYGDDWLVWQQGSPLSGTPVFGTAEPTTVEDFEDLTSAD